MTASEIAGLIVAFFAGVQLVLLVRVLARIVRRWRDRREWFRRVSAEHEAFIEIGRSMEASPEKQQLMWQLSRRRFLSDEEIAAVNAVIRDLPHRDCTGDKDCELHGSTWRRIRAFMKHGTTDGRLIARAASSNKVDPAPTSAISQSLDPAPGHSENENDEGRPPRRSMHLWD